MRPMIAALICAFVWPAPAAVEAQTVEGERIEVGPGETRFVAVAADPAPAGRLLAASPTALYESVDGGAQWQPRWRVPGRARIQSIVGGDSGILVATTDGLYGSFDGGTAWSRVFRGRGGETDCRHVAFHPLKAGTALLGTGRGLFLSADQGRHWTELSLPAAAREVIHFAFHPTDPDQAYVVTPTRLFIGHLTTGIWEQRLTLIRAGEEEVEEPAVLEADPLETAEENGSFHRLSAVAVDPQEPATVYLATSRGLQVSMDEGATWQAFTRIGLPSAAVARLALQRRSPLAVYAATARGVARYAPAQERWAVLSQGPAAGQVNDLTATATHLWAATEDGIFRYALPPDPFGEEPQPSARELLGNFVHEPTMAEVREAAIRYAEVHPDKIRHWRREAGLQALLPAVNVGIDHGRSRDVHVDEGSYPNFQVFETEDRDSGVDFSITWDLGELLWNDDQTSIDVRSKLMVQLRDDIVDEVTRTYFERRRLQISLLTNPPSGQQAMLEKELKLQELTAMIDGMTGGYFSERTKVDGNP